MPLEYRDIQAKRNKRLDEKVDRTKIIKAVIVDEQGNDSGSGSIWADFNTRRVWIREVGTASNSQVPCYNIGDPVIGLPVIVGYEVGSNIREILRTDKELAGAANTTGTSFEAPALADYKAGGRLQLWLASKMIEPLATYPGTGLAVRVVAGYYPYRGERKYFSGQQNFSLTQNPNAGEHYFAGLYLDSANSLQVVYGSSVSIASDPPEPSWPVGAFQLSVVMINDTQTSITLAPDNNSSNDIFDRRMPWSDLVSSDALNNFVATTDPTANDDSDDGYSVGSLWVNTTNDTAWICADASSGAAVWDRVDGPLNNFMATSDPTANDDSGDGYEVGSLWVNITSDAGFICVDASSGAAVWNPLGGSGWPFSDIKSVDSSDSDAEYSTLTAMISGISAGQTAWLNSETFNESVDISKDITVTGAGIDGTFIEADAFIAVTISAAAHLRAVQVDNLRSASGTLNAYGISVTGDNAVLDQVEGRSNPPNATGGNSYGVNVAASNVRLLNCRGLASNANMTRHGLHVASGSVRVIGGYFSGGDAAIYIDSGATVHLEGPRLAGGELINSSGTVTGWYIQDSTGFVVFVGGGVSTPANPRPLTVRRDDNQYLARFDSAGQFGTVLLFYNDNNSSSQDNFRVNVGGTNSTRKDSLNIYATSNDNGDVGTPLLSLKSSGKEFGLGLTTPQGAFHVYDGNSGRLFVTKTGVNGTSQTIIPDGAGDVTTFLRVEIIITSNEPATAWNLFNLTPGGTFPQSVGSDSVTFTLSAAGAFTVQRTSGSHTHDVTVWAMWQ